ncbi:MAG: 2,3-butanediol dehydrogenase [Pseudonocardia sp.]|uniref:2,3-butanediol dehydrogenase n=1 Tax=unclassified Pseudonocardia TaxID=2619320 RepID=UPI00086A42CA|nr:MULTISPECIES: 2,3-butanediol dehydrogenase [unclassified Pseudonocardia]MBN9109346.1 2,3-butanediol dehydrogenase [Pseudonocardia sp.]ODU27939.1 MAG: 2,3-butanediol dehydrogenase [Pseudonocardia sp. SCN 72-51]ODV08059.1 MAG: 2,3-butanediol dehydrogenase [Pseudonocardia sp. SCN 73-27]
MKAARFYGPGDIRIDDVPEPTTQPGTVKVEVEWAGICGTDLHEYLEGPIFAPTADAPHPLTGESVPITLGHEFAGVVAEVGAGVDRVRVGDRVAVEPYIICGTCDACTQGRYNVCATLGFVGLSGYGGGFAQYVVAQERWVHPLGDLGTDVGALIEPLAVAYHAVRLSGVTPGQTALVFGSGPIGLVTTAALRAAGVEEVVVVEPAQVRKAKAPVAGATHVLDPTTTDVVAEVHELTKGRGADVSFECAGIDAVLASAIRSTRAGGTVVNVAIWGHEASVAMNDLVFREVNVLGSLAYANDHPATIEMVASGKVDPFQFITGRIELDDIVAKGFDELISNKEENVKILVRP